MPRAAIQPANVDDEAAEILRSIGDAIHPGDERGGGAPVTLPAGALAAAVFDAQGAVRTTDARFERWFDPDEVGDAVRAWLRGGRTLTPVAARDGSTTVLLLGRVSDAEGWSLPPEMREALRKGGAVLALAYRPFEERDLAERALGSWRLTPVEAKTVRGLISAGDLKEGARLAGTGYETARKALKLALRKANAQRQADLVRLLHAAVGGGDLQFAQAPLLRDALGLTDRSAGACVLLALGLTRLEAAATLKISEHAIKDELAALFDRFGLRSSTDLARLTTEAAVLLGVAGNRNLALGSSWSAQRPLRFVNRRGQTGRIALSDFGPASGQPVLLFHSAATGSLLDRRLVAALQARGLRPIAIERPGFGLTDPPERDEAGTALSDVIDVMDAFGLKKVRLACRGGEDVALAFGLKHPERLERAVLINPFTPYAVDSRWDGYMNGAKWLFVRQPHMIDVVARFLARRLSPRTLERLLRRSLSSSPADVALLRDQTVVDDYVESGRLAALRSTWGFVHEQRGYLTWVPPTLPDASAWVRLIGEQDVLYRPGDADAVWDAALPGHHAIRRADAGRMIHASHPELVAEALLA
ncbi:MAG: alpha/beta hydrolase [Alphaproteobacteria bacterium]|nr:alpha/beta hydrolase [Alphaproteobacteria bacterium]MBU1514783.1 alpha/beta hydrolase [Alphaproteobacteria bacterium]MBU2093914.1 alpha/beta hydrolase [Alphaproteobacteria bacterium]MBU2153341.1 alpha/beta hydrolase [Alphaproteobacteria bacterium]MBU2309769.1 alpha/beta hydrolase [Alphaproteobacteria bacterium]